MVSNTSSSKTHTATGSSVNYDIDFEVNTDANGEVTDIEVQVQDTDGNITRSEDGTLVLGVDYTISGLTVTTTTTYPAGYKITLYRNVDATQTNDFRANQIIPAEQLESALDKMTFLIQQIKNVSDRQLTFPLADSDSLDGTLPGESARAGFYLAFDSSGAPIVGPTFSPSGYSSLYTYAVDDIIQYNGYIFKCIQISTGNAPDDTPGDTGYWKQFQISDLASGVVTLADGTVATTQAKKDGSTKVATTAYADQAGGGAQFDVDKTVETGLSAAVVGNIVALNTSGAYVLDDRDEGGWITVGSVKSISGNDVTITKAGIVEGLSGLTTGARYYNSSTAGAYSTETSNTTRCIAVGVAISATQMLVDVDLFEQINPDNAPIGFETHWPTTTPPPSWDVADGGELSRTIYADYFALVGTTYGVGDGSTTFNKPDRRNQYTRYGYHGTVSGPNTSTDIIVLTGSDGAVLTSTQLRNGTPIKPRGADLPAGITADTTYYLRYNGTPSGAWRLYSSESDAVSGSGSYVDITDVGSGTMTFDQLGIELDDAFQGHWHIDETFGNGASDKRRGTVDSGSGFVAKSLDNRTTLISGSTGYTDDGNNGTPRTTNENRPNTTYATPIIKVSRLTSSGQPVDALMYDTGWVANSDWTNAEFTVTHNLDANLSDLIVKFFISTDGTEANAFEVHHFTRVMDTGSSSDSSRGITIFQTSVNAVKIHTATDGIYMISDASGGDFTIDNESWYYKAVVYKPQILNNVSLPATRTVAKGYTIQAQDCKTIYVDAGAAARTITLFPLEGNLGREQWIRAKDATNTITVQTQGADTIGGSTATSKKIKATGGWIKVVAGPDWFEFEAYEEDTFTASMAPATSGSITLSSGVDLLGYIRTNGFVHVMGFIRAGSVSSPVGSVVKVTTLPFVCADKPEYAERSGGGLYFSDSSAGTDTVLPWRITGGSTVTITKNASTIAALDTFYFDITYQTEE